MELLFFHRSILAKACLAAARRSARQGFVERVLKTADYRTSKQMIPVREGELLVVLATELTGA